MLRSAVAGLRRLNILSAFLELLTRVLPESTALLGVPVLASEHFCLCLKAPVLSLCMIRL